MERRAVDGARRLRTLHSTFRTAFTLVELLVAISVFLILTGMTIVMVGNVFDGEQLKSGTRQVQSLLEGARDRAIYAGEPRGVRLIYEGTPGGTELGDFTVTSMVYVKPLEPAGGLGSLEQDGMGDYNIIDLGSSVNWQFFVDQGLVDARSAEIFISNGAESAPSDVGYRYRLTGHLGGSRFTFAPNYLGDVTGGPPLPNRYYEVQLLNGILPNSEPTLLPEGVLLHLSASDLPANWPPTNGSMDIMFSPRGTIDGAVAAKGLVHLVLCEADDVVDSSNDRIGQFFTTPGQSTFEALEGELRYVTIFTRTGQVSSHKVDPNGGDPFEFSLTGEVDGE